MRYFHDRWNKNDISAVLGLQIGDLCFIESDGWKGPYFILEINVSVYLHEEDSVSINYLDESGKVYPWIIV